MQITPHQFPLNPDASLHPQHHPVKKQEVLAEQVLLQQELHRLNPSHLQEHHSRARHGLLERQVQESPDPER